MELNQTWMYKEIMQDSAVAGRCLLENAEIIDELAKLYVETKPTGIVLAARGTSLHAAVFAKYLFEEYIGLPVAVAEPSVITKYDGRLSLSDSLVIGISQSGEGEDVCAVIERGNLCGGLTVAITNTRASRLAGLSRVCLLCCAGEELSVSATKSFAAQLSLILAISAKLSGSPELSDILARSAEAFSAGLGFAEEIPDFVAGFAHMDGCMVVARGKTYPIAQEWALKLQEVGSVNAQAFPASNFLHGPIAIASRNVPALLLAIDLKTDDDMVEIIRRLCALNTNILLVTNKAELAQTSGINSILLPAWCDGAAGALAATPIIQMFACSFALANGLNPDTPEGLKKVTITK